MAVECIADQGMRWQENQPVDMAANNCMGSSGVALALMVHWIFNTAVQGSRTRPKEGSCIFIIATHKRCKP